MRVENPMLACYSGTCTDAAGLGWHNPNCWVGPSEIVARQDDEVPGRMQHGKYLLRYPYSYL